MVVEKSSDRLSNRSAATPDAFCGPRAACSTARHFQPPKIPFQLADCHSYAGHPGGDWNGNL